MLLGIPVLIIIYLVKSKHEDLPVSSTYIWKLTERFMRKMLPMQKLKRFFVFLFQLLAVAGAAFMTAQPVFYSGTSIKYIAILDASASMCTADGKGVTRFDRALEELRKLTKKINSGHTLSVMYASDEVYYLIQESSSVSDVDQIIDNTVCSMGGCDIDTALALAQETADRYPETSVVLFTDAVCTDMHNIDVVYVGDDVWNASVISLTGTEKNDLLIFTGSVVSSGTDTVLPVGLELDGQPLDVQLVECRDGVPAEVEFSIDANRYGDYRTARLFLDVEDGLPDDNFYAYCVPTEYHWKIRLLSENPRFLRSALESIPHSALRVDTALGYELSGFNLYIFDGLYPEEYPTDGAIMIFGGTDLPDGLTVTGESETPDRLTASGPSGSPLYKDLVLDSTYLARHYSLRANALWDSIFECGGDTVGAVRKSASGTVTTVLSFDVHDSNLPLQSDLTVMLRNIVDYTLPWIMEDYYASVGEELTIHLLPYEDEAYVTKPDGTVQALAMEQSAATFTPTETGVYKITEKSEEKTVSMNFFVHIPATESMTWTLDGYTVDKATGDLWTIGQEEMPKAGTKLSVWIAAAVLVFMLAEWGISCREEL